MADDRALGLGAWCCDCRATANLCCWEHHSVLNAKAALRRELREALPQAAGQLEALLEQCRSEQALQALALLTGGAWEVTLRARDSLLTGTVRNDAADPVTKALWVALAARGALVLQHRDGAMPLPPHAPPAAVGAARANPEELDAREASASGPDDKLLEKRDALQAARGVRRLISVVCCRDPAWTLLLLERAGPTVEELGLSSPRAEHLLAAHAMPLLRRLFLWGDRQLDALPAVLPPLPPGRGLRWLKVWALPRATLQALLQAHGHSLEELHLMVGPAAPADRPRLAALSWPAVCADLDALLGWCGLRALRRLILRRKGYWHDTAPCLQQREAVRRALPGVEVLCSDCGDARGAGNDLFCLSPI